MTTQIHDSTTCTAGFNGQPCVMCHFAREFEKSGSKSPSEASGVENQPAGFLVPEPESGLERNSVQSSPIPAAPDFDREWSRAPTYLKQVFHPSLIRAAVFDVIDQGCNCATAGKVQHPWKFEDEIEDFANEQRARFVDAVIARLSEWRGDGRDPSSEYFFLRGVQSGVEMSLVAMNQDLKETQRMARERMGR